MICATLLFFVCPKVAATNNMTQDESDITQFIKLYQSFYFLSLFI